MKYVLQFLNRIGFALLITPIAFVSFCLIPFVLLISFLWDFRFRYESCREFMGIFGEFIEAWSFKHKITDLFDYACKR